MLLQKKDSEGFGFVLRGAKGEKWEITPNILPWSRPHQGCDRLHFVVFSSSDSYRGVHPHPGLPRAAVPGVRGRGRRRLESRPQDGRFPDRGTATFYLQPFKKYLGPRCLQNVFDINPAGTENDSLPLCVSGQRSERGEGWSPAGRQHDPARRQQPHGQGCHGNPQP